MRCSRAINGEVRDSKAKSEKRWDLTCTAVLSFICAVGKSVMIYFPRKKMTFCFNNPHDPAVESRKQKN
jgi:hypothetical protein